ncbi:hypothetical protein MNBD_GAMMA26-1166 [hydrothermal vent metagenome]|uniref:Uncharacterized protein n=1 Tax=hydrothermal vent metagenome TaxID=652676 RepID=A0A3B1B0R0_9ZZZZ
MADHTVDDVTGYLKSVGRQGWLADWQFVQTISAIQNLLQTAKAQAQTEVDWSYCVIQLILCRQITLLLPERRSSMMMRRYPGRGLSKRGIMPKPFAATSRSYDIHEV